VQVLGDERRAVDLAHGRLGEVQELKRKEIDVTRYSNWLFIPGLPDFSWYNKPKRMKYLYTKRS
jgi:hypothetical protein